MIHEAEHWRTVDDFGIVMPWYTRPCLAWLDNVKLGGATVWEYGGGQSTHWFRSRGAIVSGVDTSEEWSAMAGLVYAKEKIRFLTSINGYFDFICIDGEYRDDCFIYALNHLAPLGTIIIDNWKQASAWGAEWPETERLIREHKLMVTEYPQEGHPDWVTITIT